MAKAVFLGLSLLSGTLLPLMALVTGQRPFTLKHPNHNYFPNGTLMHTNQQVKYSSPGDTWGFSPSNNQNNEDHKKQELFKVNEWDNPIRPHAPPMDHMMTSESAVYESVIHVPKAQKLINNRSSGKDAEQMETLRPPVEDDLGGVVGSQTPPRCADTGRYYCSYKEEYPLEVVTQVTKFLKWPLEKLFRDLKIAKLPKIAESSQGSLVCDSVSRVVRPGWAKNTNGRWLVVINTESYHQYITEVVCRYDGAFCNFIPPCYHATCQQRFNTQSLLVVDPLNPYKGPFMSQFLFPSCCVCFIPNTKP